MAIPAAAIAKAAIGVLSNEKTRKAAGWVLVAILSPIILLIAAFCSILGGSADHNSSILDLCFYGGTLPADIPAEYRAYIEDMQASFALLDERIAEINSMTEDGESLDAIRVKAFFYALYFGAESPSSRAHQQFVDCFVTYEERTRPLDSTDSEDESTGEPEEETYTVAIPITDIATIWSNIQTALGETVTEEQRNNADSIRNGSAAKYMRYIATREGVEKLHGRGPVTQPQKELIERLLKDYPDTKELFEYSDYCASPTFGNASELITMALDANVHTMEAGDGYLKYIATRPRVEKRGDHGLFSDTQDVSLQDMMAEVAEHHGPVWTVILSLRREDASALGYDSAENWRTLLLQHRTRLAQAMKIPVDDFRWCAAFHDEGYHPHVHMMVWSADEKHGYLNKTGITAMRSALTNTIFQDEMHNLYVKKDLAYQDLVKQSRSAMAELIARMESTSLDNDSIARKMVELANALGSVKGKKQYGYLPKKLKELVDAITDELALQPDVAACYQVWNDLRDKLEGYYKDKPRVHNPLSKQKEFKAIKNSIIREADRLRLELEQEEMDSTNPYTNEESGEIDLTETPPKTDSAQQPIKSPAVNNHNPAVIAAVTRLLYHMGQIFRDNAMAPTSPLGLRIDSKRRKKLMAKRLALGHKADDHEEQGWQNGPSM